jgi:hypothetical protein
MDMASPISYFSSQRARVPESLINAGPSARTSYFSPEVDFDEVPSPASVCGRDFGLEETIVGKLNGKSPGSGLDGRGCRSLTSVQHRRRLRLGRVGWKSRLDYLGILTRIWTMGSSRHQLSSIARITPHHPPHPNKPASRTSAGRRTNHQLRLTLILLLLSVILDKRRRIVHPKEQERAT